jgi:ubiquinone/menaquinone biosynthesis C-methylase UbiE
MSEQGQRPGQWQVSGSAPEVYEEQLVPAIFAPWAPLVVDLAHPRAGDRVLDVACGTGIVARTVAERVGPAGAVVGVDLNPGMLRVARTRCSPSRHGVAPVEWQEASADNLPFPNASFDVAYCQLGLQFFSDRPAALCEMHRVLVAGGRLPLMVWRSLGESPGFAVLADALERRVGPAAAAIMRAPFSLSDADELAALVRDADFRDVAVQPRTGMVRFPSVEKLVLSYVAGSPLAGPVSQADPAAREALVGEAQQALRKYTSATEVAFPIAAHLLSANASDGRAQADPV